MSLPIAEIPTKACPVVFRPGPSWELLAFEHPLAGFQLVKGTIEPGESPADAAVRELREESGLETRRIRADLGTWQLKRGRSRATAWMDLADRG